MFLRDMPPAVHYRLHSILDITDYPNSWRQLATVIGRFNMEDIQRFQREQLSGRSPTEILLRVWDYDNIVVKKLYLALHEMKHATAMTVLKPHVDREYHYLIDEIERDGCDVQIPQPQQQQQPMGSPGNNLYVHHGHPQQPPPRYPQPVSGPEYHQPVSVPDTGQQRFAAGPYPELMPTSPHQPTGDTYGDNMMDRHPEKLVNGGWVPSGQGAFQTDEESLKKKKQQFNAMMAMNTTIHKTYEDIRAATNNFDEAEKLGEGSFGTVYLATINMTKYAVKVLRSSEHVSLQLDQRTDQMKELRALANYKHQNIVLLCFFSVDGERPCLIYEYLENGSLEDNLMCKDGRRPLGWKLRHEIAEGVALGINHLHKASKTDPLIHGDIKSANILLGKHFEPKIADFGLARPGPANDKSYTILKTKYAHGTLPYLPEEFHRSLRLSTRVDIYSFGVVLMEMLTGEKAYDDRREPSKLLVNHVQDITEMSQFVNDQLRDKRCCDWPDSYFGDFLKLSQKCVETFKKRPEMNYVVSELMRIKGGIDADKTTEKISASATQNTDSLASDEVGENQWQYQRPENKVSDIHQSPERKLYLGETKHSNESGQMMIQQPLYMQLQNMKMANQDIDDKQSQMQKAQIAPVTNHPMDHGYRKYDEQIIRHLQGPPERGASQQPGTRLGHESYPGIEDSRTRFPDTYRDQIRPDWQKGPQMQQMLPPNVVPSSPSNNSRDVSSTSESSNNASSYSPGHYFVGKERDAIYEDGYRHGYAEAMRLCQSQQTGMTSFPNDRESLWPGFGAPVPSPEGYMQTVDNRPSAAVNYPPMSGGGRNHGKYGTPGLGQCSGLNSQQPYSNVTDDLKINSTVMAIDTMLRKTRSDLDEKQISLQDMRQNKEPQQSTEPLASSK